MINPELVTTARVGELPSLPFNLTDNIPHESGTELYRGTLQSMADVIGTYLATAGGVGFRAVTVLDGETLPSTSTQEFILVGKGTFPNVGGGDTIITTEELNALISNGSYWSIGVEIPIDVELAGITQNIRSGYTLTTPSENAVFNALALKANVTDIVTALTMIDYPILLAPQASFELPEGKIALYAFVNQTPYFLSTANNTGYFNTFTQTGNTVTFTNTLETGEYLVIFYQ